MSSHEHSEPKKEGIFKKIFHHHDKNSETTMTEPSTTAAFLDPGPATRLPDIHDEQHHESTLPHRTPGHDRHAESPTDSHEHKKRERNRLHKEPPESVKKHWYEEGHPTDSKTNEPLQQDQGYPQIHDYAANKVPAITGIPAQHDARYYDKNVQGHQNQIEPEQQHNQVEPLREGHQRHAHDAALLGHPGHAKHATPSNDAQQTVNQYPHSHHNRDAAVLGHSGHATSSNSTQLTSSHAQQAVNQDDRHGLTKSEELAGAGAVGLGGAAFGHHYKDKHVPNTTEQGTIPPKNNETNQLGHAPVFAGLNSVGHNQDRQAVNDPQHQALAQPPHAVTTSGPIASHQPPTIAETGNHSVTEAAAATTGAIGVAGLASHHQKDRQTSTLGSSTLDDDLPKVPTTDGKFMDRTPSTFNLDSTATTTTSSQQQVPKHSAAIASTGPETTTIGKTNALKQATDFKQPDDVNRPPTYFERPVGANQAAGGPASGLSQGVSSTSHTGHLTDAFSPGSEGVNMPGRFPTKD